MKPIPLLIILIIVSLLFIVDCNKLGTATGPLINYTEISGSLSGTLTLSGSPYAIIADSYVPSGSTWMIEPGVEICFKDYYRLTVDGVLQAIGAPGQPITFGVTYDNPGTFEGIVFTNPSQSSILEYCTIRDGAIYSPPDSVTYRIRGAIHCLNSSPVIQKCLLVDNGYNAIYCDFGSAPLIDGCTITKNSFSGVVCEGNSSPLIRNSIIVSNLDYGVFAVIGSSSAPHLEYCNIWDNFTTDVYGAFYDTTFWPGMLSEPPQFVNPDLGDFSLLSHSNCIDAGDPGSVQDPDFTRMDMGAFYYDQSDSSELRGSLNLKWGGVLPIDYSPYFATCNISIDSGATFMIDPGVIIEINASTDIRFNFDIEGTLIAKGMPSAPIVIRSSNYPGSRGDWNQFHIFDVDTAVSCTLSYVQISHASEFLVESQLIADHCAFSDFENPVNIASGDTSKFDFCIFKSNGTAGLLCDNSNSIILHSVFYLNQGYGLLCDNYAQPQVTNNIFFQNSIHGVKCNNFSAPNIINNTFIDNLYYGIFLNLNSNPDFRNNIVYGNNKGGIVCEAASFPAINYNDVFFNNIDSVMVVNQQTMDTTWIIDSTGLNFDNCPSGVGDFDTTGIDVFHNFSLGPAFLNYVDFTLSGASPCIDAGDPSSQFNDYDGSRNDLGAFGGPLGDWMPPEFMDFIPPSFYGSFSTR